MIIMTKIPHNPPTPQDPGSLTSCPAPRKTIKEIANQLRRDLDASVPFSQIKDGSYFSFLPPDTPGGVWRKTPLLSYNAVNDQIKSRLKVREYDIVVPVKRYAEAA